MNCDDRRLMEYLPWAQRFARTCAIRLPSHLDHDDLQSAGVLGYLRAAARYDAKKGASFRGFCAVRIRGAVLDELRRWDWAPRSVHKTGRRITQITSTLFDQLDREPTSQELAEALGIDPTELSSYQTQAQPHQVVSLDEVSENPLGEENLTLGERLADPAQRGPDHRLLSVEDREMLARCLSRLPKSEVTVLVLHYLQSIPLRDIAEALAVTPSRVSQLHHQALGRIRQAWSRKDTSRRVPF